MISLGKLFIELTASNGFPSLFPRLLDDGDIFIVIQNNIELSKSQLINLATAQLQVSIIMTIHSVGKYISPVTTQDNILSL